MTNQSETSELRPEKWCPGQRKGLFGVLNADPLHQQEIRLCRNPASALASVRRQGFEPRTR